MLCLTPLAGIASGQNELQSRLVAKHNLVRVAAGKRSQQLDAELCRGAQVHAEWMAATGCFTHSDWRCRAGRRIHGAEWHPVGTISGEPFIAENITKITRDPIGTWSDAIHCPDHRAAMLGPETHCGFGGAVDRCGVHYWCALYGHQITSELEGWKEGRGAKLRRASSPLLLSGEYYGHENEAEFETNQSDRRQGDRQADGHRSAPAGGRSADVVSDPAGAIRPVSEMAGQNGDQECERLRGLLRPKPRPAGVGSVAERRLRRAVPRRCVFRRATSKSFRGPDDGGGLTPFFLLADKHWISNPAHDLRPNFEIHFAAQGRNAGWPISHRRCGVNSQTRKEAGVPEGTCAFAPRSESCQGVAIASRTTAARGDGPSLALRPFSSVPVRVTARPFSMSDVPLPWPSFSIQRRAWSAACRSVRHSDRPSIGLPTHGRVAVTVAARLLSRQPSIVARALRLGHVLACGGQRLGRRWPPFSKGGHMEVSLLAALLERHPTPWRVSRRRNLPISRSEAVEIADARSCRVLEVDSSTLADGLVEAINLAATAIVPSEGFARIDRASPNTPDCVIPWRGQESLEAIEDSIS